MSKIIYNSQRRMYKADFHRVYNSLINKLSEFEPELHKDLSSLKDTSWDVYKLNKAQRVIEIYLQELLDSIDLEKRANTSWTSTYSILGKPIYLYKIREPDYTIYELQSLLDVINISLENNEPMYIGDFSMIDEKDEILLRFIKNHTSVIVEEELSVEAKKQDVTDLGIRMTKLEENNFIKLDGNRCVLTDKGERVTW